MSLLKLLFGESKGRKFDLARIFALLSPVYAWLVAQYPAQGGLITTVIAVAAVLVGFVAWRIESEDVRRLVLENDHLVLMAAGREFINVDFGALAGSGPELSPAKEVEGPSAEDVRLNRCPEPGRGGLSLSY